MKELEPSRKFASYLGFVSLLGMEELQNLYEHPEELKNPYAENQKQEKKRSLDVNETRKQVACSQCCA